MKIIIFYILFLFCALNNFLSSNDYCGLSLESLNGINKSVTFLKDYYSEIDFDGLYGFQLLENYLKTITRFQIKNICQKNGDVIYAKIQNQTKRLSEIIKLSKVEVKKADPKYYKKLGKVTKSFIKINTRYKFLQGDIEKIKAVQNYKRDSNYNEEFGDSCLKEITDNCSISDICFINFVNSSIGEEYVATHQAIYLGLYIKNKCFLNKSSQNKKSLQENLQKICLKLNKYNVDFLQHKTEITDMTVDLFLEIIVICGGQFRYLDFLSIKTFHLIQKFQNKNGCFEYNKFFTQKLERNFINVIPKENDLLVRKKRRNKSINGCESHTLGLGAASFGAFLQRFLRIK